MICLHITVGLWSFSASWELNMYTSRVVGSKCCCVIQSIIKEIHPTFLWRNVFLRFVGFFINDDVIYILILIVKIISISLWEHG